MVMITALVLLSVALLSAETPAVDSATVKLFATHLVTGKGR